MNYFVGKKVFLNIVNEGRAFLAANQKVDDGAFTRFLKSFLEIFLLMAR